MGRIKNAILEEQYEREREEEAHAERECIKMIGDMNIKIDTIMASVHICSNQISLANQNIALLLERKQLKKKNMRKNILLFLGGICGVTGICAYYKK